MPITKTINNTAVDTALTSHRHELIIDILDAYFDAYYITRRFSKRGVTSFVLSNPCVQKSFEVFEKSVRQTDELPSDEKKGRS